MIRMSTILLLSMVAVGCQQPLRPVFPEVSPSREWPPRPDIPRIRYIGELTGEESLGKPQAWGLKSLLAGPEPQVAFSTPTSVVAHADRVYVADGQNHAVYILDIVSRDFRTITGPPQQSFQWPACVTVVDNRIAVADSKGAAVFIFEADGRFVRTIGTGLLQRPTALAWNPSARQLWVLDTALQACIAFDADGREMRRVGRRGESLGEFNYPAGMCWSPQIGLAVADSMNFRVQLLADDGQPRRMFGRKGDAAGDFSLPRDVAVDSEGHLYVLDSQFENVQIFDEQGRLLMAWGGEGRGPGEFYLPSGIFIDEQDRIWVADTYNRRVQVFQYLRQMQTRE